MLKRAFAVIFTVGMISSLEAADKATLQNDFKVFEVKCSKCHNIQTSLTGTELLPSDIQAMITKMSQMEGANISADEQKTILDFMIYYTASSKKDALRQALKNLPEDKLQTELAQIKAAIAKYKE